MDINDLTGLQEDAQALGFIHDPVFYLGEDSGEYKFGAIFQIVSPSVQDAMRSGLSSLQQLLEGILPEEDLLESLTYYSLQLEYEGEYEEDEKVAA